MEAFRGQLRNAYRGCKSRLPPSARYPICRRSQRSAFLSLVEKQFSLKSKREFQDCGDPMVQLLFQSVADAGRQLTVAVVLADFLAHSKGLAAIGEAGDSAMVMCSLSFAE